MIESQEELLKEPQTSAYQDFLATSTRLARRADARETDDPAVAQMPMIMVVEDDVDISRSLQIRLGMHGFRVCQAFDAVLAMDVAKRHRPDLVILDISMPGGSGFDVADRLRAEPGSENVPIIFLTASLRPDLPERASLVGASAFLTKPYDSAQLLSEVRRLVSGAYELGD